MNALQTPLIVPMFMFSIEHKYYSTVHLGPNNNMGMFRNHIRNALFKMTSHMEFFKPDCFMLGLSTVVNGMNGKEPII